MCGIVGAIAQRDVAEILLEGLKKLEYRGYDSAGIAIINSSGKCQHVRTKGKVENLFTAFKNNPLLGSVGISHTRWATHGIPSEKNAHPHMSGEDLAIVHNGIIENHEKLKKFLIQKGYEFKSETDTETIVHLIHYEFTKNKNLFEAIKKAVKQLNGAYALGIIHTHSPEKLFAVRHGSPLVIGLGIGENFIASDNLALLPVTQKFIFLEDGDIAEITRKKITIFDKNEKIVTRNVHESELQNFSTTRGKYRHFMLKEIFEQPEVLANTLEGHVANNKVLPESFGINAANIFAQIERIQIVACGTSYHAGMVAKYWFEELAKIPCDVEIASEFRYRKKAVAKNTLFVAISQSGETADTLAALKQSKEIGFSASLAICNVPESTIVRESDLVFITKAGKEIGVASTKAFSTQLLALFLLVMVFAENKIDGELKNKLLHKLKTLPEKVSQALELNEKIKSLAAIFEDKNSALFLGRGVQYPVAMEGALKLKEISYIHAEAYPAGELKHGPLALVDKDMPIVTVAPNDELLEKLKSNLEEVRARGGQLIVFADHRSGLTNAENIKVLEMPKANPFLAPIVYTIPLQLLAYHVAIIKGTDIDQPRNLAKSVTVE